MNWSQIETCCNSSCESQIDSDMLFCPYCGAKQKREVLNGKGERTFQNLALLMPFMKKLTKSISQNKKSNSDILKELKSINQSLAEIGKVVRQHDKHRRAPESRFDESTRKDNGWGKIEAWRAIEPLQ